MTTDAPPTSPARPTLEPQPGKPDVTGRLKAAGDLFRLLDEGYQLPPNYGGLAETMSDAIATIEGLRAANLRHCKEEEMLKDARARVAELEATIRSSIQAFREAGEKVDPVIAGTLATCADVLERRLPATQPAPLPDAPQTGEAGR